MIDRHIKSGSPESFGWQRRPDQDMPTWLAYESPTGELVLFPCGVKPQVRQLVRKDLPMVLRSPK